MCSVLNTHPGTRRIPDAVCFPPALESFHGPRPSSGFPGDWDVLWAPHQGQVLLLYPGLNTDDSCWSPDLVYSYYISRHCFGLVFAFPSYSSLRGLMLLLVLSQQSTLAKSGGSGVYRWPGCISLRRE